MDFDSMTLDDIKSLLEEVKAAYANRVFKESGITHFDFIPSSADQRTNGGVTFTADTPYGVLAVDHSFGDGIDVSTTLDGEELDREDFELGGDLMLRDGADEESARVECAEAVIEWVRNCDFENEEDES